MSAPNGARPARRGLVVALLPLVIFLAIAGLFLSRLGSDSSRLPSALVGRAAPQFDLPALEGAGKPALATADLKSGGVTLVNVFASWCGPCRDEHPILLRLSRDESLRAKGVRLAGLNYKDNPENALSFLRELGDPYQLIGVDRSGRTGLEWGVYGVPETFVVRGDGTVAYRFVGPLSEKSAREVLLPQIEKALQPPQAAAR